MTFILYHEMLNHREKNIVSYFQKKLHKHSRYELFHARVLKHDKRKCRKRWFTRINAKNSRNDMKYPRNRSLSLPKRRAQLVKLISI